MTELTQHLACARRVVVKIGSSLMSGAGRNGTPLPLATITGDLLQSLSANSTPAFVSSGAVALGRQRLAMKDRDVAAKQALSAVGQIELMERWRTALAAHERIAAQVLLTPDITRHRQRYLNARATIRTLHTSGAIPIINENDAVATDGIRYSDNDRLAAMTAGLIEADCLVLLTDIDGLYTNNPKIDNDASPIPTISWEALKNLNKSTIAGTSSEGRGGMATKVEAARMAGGWGISVMILDGRTDTPFSKPRGTFVTPSAKPTSARKKWLGGAAFSGSAVWIDTGAEEALLRGASLLCVGVVRVEGQFAPGDAVTIKNEKGDSLGFGLSRLSSDGVAACRGDLVVHRNDLAFGNA